MAVISDEAHWLSLPPATALPVGTFAGVAWSHDLPGMRLVNRIWRGKYFAGMTVWNCLFGTWLIRGTVTLEAGEVVIRYGWGLTDRLKPDGAGGWLGRMELHGRVIWFALT